MQSNRLVIVFLFFLYVHLVIYTRSSVINTNFNRVPLIRYEIMNLIVSGAMRIALIRNSCLNIIYLLYISQRFCWYYSGVLSYKSFKILFVSLTYIFHNVIYFSTGISVRNNRNKDCKIIFLNHLLMQIVSSTNRWIDMYHFQRVVIIYERCRNIFK